MEINGVSYDVVALRKESVDRNYKERPGQKARPVALRKESVDRNQNCCPYLSSLTVALRKESVDRNNCNSNFTQKKHRRSPQGERG